MKIYITENNSGGVTYYLACSIHKLSKQKPYRMVVVECNNLDEGLRKFENYFNLDLEHENSYEGNSCGCCGRRFEIIAPTDETKYNYIDIDVTEKPHYDYEKYKEEGSVLEI